MDSSKAIVADHRHRAIFHSSFGVFIVEKIFGTNITNSEGKLVSVREIAEIHVLEDMNRIPDAAEYLRSMRIEKWMQGIKKLSD